MLQLLLKARDIFRRLSSGTSNAMNGISSARKEEAVAFMLRGQWNECLAVVGAAHPEISDTDQQGYATEQLANKLLYGDFAPLGARWVLMVANRAEDLIPEARGVVARVAMHYLSELEESYRALSEDDPIAPDMRDLARSLAVSFVPGSAQEGRAVFLWSQLNARFAVSIPGWARAEAEIVRDSVSPDSCLYRAARDRLAVLRPLI